MQIDAKKFPRLAELLKSETITVVKGEYVGKASDGVKVNIGLVGEEARAEKYLRACPTPKDW